MLTDFKNALITSFKTYNKLQQSILNFATYLLITVEMIPLHHVFLIIYSFYIYFIVFLYFLENEAVHLHMILDMPIGANLYISCEM